ncbi:MAG TPA: hypothetical protein VMY77_03980 [Chitinophagaceae bacterium]|nr:hypothetical protein [Chitinophagaceae bacterium]
MINKQELRLGNWVILHHKHDNDHESELQVKELSLNGPIQLSNSYSTYIKVSWEDILPLPIDSCHLKKFGFQETSKDIFSFDDWVYEAPLKLLHWKSGIELQVQYVHQLQNIIFTLSRVELQMSQGS